VGIPEKDKQFRRGQVLFKEGQQISVAFMVKKGLVTVFRVVNNRRVVLTTVGPGQFVGELGLITGEPFHATAEAAEYTECIAFDRPLLQSLIIKSPNPLQRIMKSLVDRVCVLERTVHEQSTGDAFISLCQLLELACEAEEGRAHVRRAKQHIKHSIGYVDFCRQVKNILLISQAEIDLVLDKLDKVNLINIRDVKGATYKKDLLGEVYKSAEYLRDRILVITDRKSFMSAARNLRRETQPERTPPYTDGLEHLDLVDFVHAAGTTRDEVLRRVGAGELPDSLLYLPRALAEAWAAADAEGLERLTRANGELRLETVNDIVLVRGGVLREAFTRIGFRSLAILHAAANDAARQKIEDNLSEKMAKVVKDEATSIQVDVTHLSNIEHELFTAIRELMV